MFRVMSVCILGCLLPLAGNAAQLLLTWTDNSSNETGFLIERAAIGGAFFQIASTAANVTSFTDSNLADSTDYSYRIRAYRGTLFSTYTGSVSARTRAQQADANTPPTVSSVANRSVVAAGSTGALPFTVGDSATPAASLTVTSTSSNPSLVPASAIVLRGSGANRTITVTPPGTSSGTATITIRVSDGALATSTTFVLTVTALNPPPVVVPVDPTLVTPANLAPTVTTLASRTVVSPASTGPIAFTIGDSQTAASSLVVTGSSSNTSLVPNSAIVFAGSGANRTVTVTPAGTQTGSATITVRVSDGSLATNTTFVLTVTAPIPPPIVTPVNLAPTVTTLSSRTVVSPASSGPIAFTIGDTQTAASRLVVTGSSSNTTLVPNSAIVFAGSGANRTVTVTPAGTQTGSATITVSVSDGSMATSTTFVLTVTAPIPPPIVAPVNLPPTVTTPTSRTVESRSSTGPIPFTVGDSQTAAASLVVTGSSSNPALVPNSAIVLGGSGANRTVTVTPNASATGSALISLTVFDGALSTTTAFTLTVKPFTAPPVISGISNLSTSVNGLVHASFTIEDSDTPIELLQITAASSNAQLLPSSSLSIGGALGSRTLSATLVRGASGTTLITLTANDGVKTTNLQITLTVLTANTVPWIAGLADLTTRANFLVGQPFTAGDAETSASSLSISATSSNQLLIANSAIRLGENGLQRSIAVIPSRGRTGTAIISITITDGVLSSTKTFTVRVTP